MANDAGWHVAVYAPSVEDSIKGMPYVIVSHIEGREPAARFARTAEDAEKIRAQQHEMIWRAEKKFHD